MWTQTVAVAVADRDGKLDCSTSSGLRVLNQQKNNNDKKRTIKGKIREKISIMNIYMLMEVRRHLNDGWLVCGDGF